VSGHKQDLGDKAQDAAQEAADSRWVDRVSRAGLAARAVVYLMVAYLAARIALGAAGVGPVTDRPSSDLLEPTDASQATSSDAAGSGMSSKSSSLAPLPQQQSGGRERSP
jgi:hypothetical protein